MNIRELVETLRIQWAAPRQAIHRGEPCPFSLKCSFAEPASGLGPLERTRDQLPSEIMEFWQICSSARLFEDTEFGQWGLEVLSPEGAAALTSSETNKRPSDYIGGDLLVGRFLGDSDLLLLRCDSTASDFGTVKISLPIDRRNEWDTVAQNFEDFLTKYVTAQGDKFWEPRSLPQ